MIGLTQTNGKWALKFKGDQMMYPQLDMVGILWYAGEILTIW
jgi:hypothetical protein